MEVNKRFLTVLTSEGEFLRARKENPHYQIGQEIMFTPVTLEKKASFFPVFQGKRLWPATVALLLIFLFVIPVYQNNQVYAYVSIDINPSIEIGVNKKYQVIELKPYNNDGEKVIKQIQDWKHEDADTVVSSIIDEIKKQGYMKDKRKMVVASVYAEDDTEEQDSWKEEMEVIQGVISTEKLDLTIVEGTVSEREKAIEEGMTLGLYKEKKLKEHNAKVEAKKKLNENNANAEANKKLKENNTKAELHNKSVPAKEKSKPVENPAQTDGQKQKEQTNAVKGNMTKMPPGQSKKEEKLQGNAENPADAKQENAVANPANEETSNNQVQKVKENNDNNNKQNENNGNNGNGNEKQNHEDNSNGLKANQPASDGEGESNKKNEK